MIFLKRIRTFQSIFKSIVSLNKNIPYFKFSNNNNNDEQLSSFKDLGQPPENDKDILKPRSETEKKISIIQKNSVSNESNTLVFAQYLPLDWNENALKNHFDPTNIYISKIVLVKNRLGVYSGKAMFEFVSKEVCEKFVNKWHENFIESAHTFRRIVFKPLHLKTNTQKAQIQGGLKQVYLYNLDASATPDDIYSVASEFGEITQMQFPVHEGTKKHKGYGFITFKIAKSAQKFLDFADGKEFFGKSLRVQVKDFKFDTQKKEKNSYSNAIFERNPNKAELKNANMKENIQIYEELTKSEIK